MKLSKLFALLLAGGLLVSCTPKAPADTTTAAQSVSDAPSDSDSPIGAITPGAAEQHLVQEEGAYTLYSPDGTLAIRIATEGQMSYSVIRVRDGKATEWVRPSTLGITAGKKTYCKDSTVVSATAEEVKVNYPLYGNQRNVEGHCMEAVLTLNNGSDYTLEVRAYNDGVAFRYSIPSASARSTLQELTTYSLRTDIEQCWYGVNNQDYESEIAAYDPNKASRDIITAPLTAELKDNRGYISIMEGALNETYPGVNLQADGNATYSTCFYTNPTFKTGPVTTGWRIINIADTLNDLVNNTNIYTVNEAAGELYADTDWIEVGRSAWSWCMTHSAPTYEQMREYTIAAALLGYEYNIIDDGWPGWEDYKERLTELGILGEDLNVKQLLWGGITAGTAGYNRTPDKASVDTYMQLLQDTHMYGAKVDFWWSDADTNTTTLQKYILEEAAKLHYIIDFHGCNKNTGLNITYPNELSREGVRGLENIGAANTTNYTTYAKWLNMQLYTRFLCGHADWTPATYNAMEIASLICIDSPLMVVAADPAEILASPAVEFIKSIPTVWDRTVVLSDSKIGTYSAYAKENNGTWFVGGISSESRNATVKLSEFLPEGTYAAEIWVDTDNGMEKKTLTVTASDEINVGALTEGRGFAIRLSKLSLSRYGGEIGEVTVTAPDGSTVKYTVDGSDPLTSSTAIVCNGTITLTSACRLQVAITDGDGKGTLLSYQFNEIGVEHTFVPTVEYGDSETYVTLDAGDASAKIYYTLDGSEPTVDSALLEGTVLTVTESCTLRYLVVIGDLSFDGSTNVKVRVTLSVPESDLALTDADPIAAPTIGWGSAHYDTSMAPDNGMTARKISLGGTSLDTGTFFDRGISANATSTFQYAVPEGYTRFVGVAGVDDCVFNNTGDRAKASGRLILSFDGTEVYTSEIFRMGEYVYFDVEIPEGASTLTIRLDDGGDGNTCDNLSLAAPGWVK